MDERFEGLRRAAESVVAENEHLEMDTVGDRRRQSA
jgi:hypothetical protein